MAGRLGCASLPLIASRRAASSAARESATGEETALRAARGLEGCNAVTCALSGRIAGIAADEWREARAEEGEAATCQKQRRSKQAVDASLDRVLTHPFHPRCPALRSELLCSRHGCSSADLRLRRSSADHLPHSAGSLPRVEMGGDRSRMGESTRGILGQTRERRQAELSRTQRTQLADSTATHTFPLCSTRSASLATRSALPP